MSTLAPALTYALPARRHPVLQFILHQPLGAGGLVFIVIMALAAIFAPWVTPYDPLTVDYGSMLAAPSWQHCALARGSVACSSAAPKPRPAGPEARRRLRSRFSSSWSGW